MIRKQELEKGIANCRAYIEMLGTVDNLTRPSAIACLRLEQEYRTELLALEQNSDDSNSHAEYKGGNNE